MIISALLENYPGKAAFNGENWLPLWAHSKDTAEIMIRLIDDWLPQQTVSIFASEKGELEKLFCFVALIHDIGKLTPVFASKIMKQLPEQRERLESLGLPVFSIREFPNAKQTPHAKAGEAILLDFGCPPGVASVVGSHHGKPQEHKPSVSSYEEHYYASDQLREKWKTLQKEFFSWGLTEAGYNSASEIPEISQAAQVVLTGLLIMADWLASNEDYFPHLLIDEDADMSAWPARTDAAWEKLRLPEAWAPASYVMDDRSFTENFGFEPNEVQEMVINAVNNASDGMFILEAQMGVGKTEAALAAAEILASRNGSGGVFFGLPTQATANGLFPRLKSWAEGQAKEAQRAIRLAHGMAELNEEYRSIFHGTADTSEDGAHEERLIVHQWFNGRKQALLSDFVIGTVDQLLMAALKQKHVMLRHLGLAGKVVILDECHAYDAYMNQYLDRTLNWLGAYHVPVIVLSATLPEQRRAELIKAYLNNKIEETDNKWRTERSYPLLTWTEGRTVRQCTAAMERKDRHIKIQNLDNAELIQRLRELTANGACCGIIVNTVRAAQELAGEIAETLPDAKRVLLHARFVATDRAEKEIALLNSAGKNALPESRSGLIVIGTQVLEQSLDIDFDVLFTQLCPMDLLLQRIGRLFRHTRKRPETCETPRCFIMDGDKEPDEGSRAVYGDWLLLRTRELLPDFVSIPESIPELVQETYQEPNAEQLDDIHRKAWEKQADSVKTQKEKAKNYRIPKPSGRRSSTLDGWLNVELPVDGARGEAAVRDGEPNIAVLVMQRHTDGRVTFLPWQEGGREVDPSHVPDDETARQIARQKLTLPLSFSLYGRDEQTIRELETRNRRELSEWQNSGWLSGELILLLDDSLCAELSGQHIRYTQEYGLVCERIGDDNEF